ncbi:RNA polymerase sigma factor [Clostridium sp. C105KSO13]|uniref:RNA polymerase sigma factor n=1 Tax=Clostridium sp. C105KSO13 TaxID=1776045 RepID=UPI0007405D2A|nr:sigma-70 family RNA polymerase sigma factor [Clostridium sp. C105KSO13]CUX32921.1 RNA polymerase factor sigma C [Clostridium sp. C105KSO13]
MRGKKPKERKSYVLRMGDGTLVEVTREIYLEWYQSKRREKYQQERSRKFGVCSLDGLAQKGDFLKGDMDTNSGAEEIAIKNLCTESIKNALNKLPEPDAYLIYLLFYEEVKVKEAAQIFGCSRKTILNRKKRILGQLNKIMNELGIEGDCL